MLLSSWRGIFLKRCSGPLLYALLPPRPAAAFFHALPTPRLVARSSSLFRPTPIRRPLSSSSSSSAAAEGAGTKGAKMTTARRVTRSRTKPETAPPAEKSAAGGAPDGEKKAGGGTPKKKAPAKKAAGKKVAAAKPAAAHGRQKGNKEETDSPAEKSSMGGEVDGEKKAGRGAPTKKSPVKKAPAKKTAAKNAAAAKPAPKRSASPTGAPAAKKRTAARPVQAITARSPLPRLGGAAARPPLRVLSWNVNGLRALLKNRPGALEELCAGKFAGDPWASAGGGAAVPYDVVCLQETKLQTEHVGREVPEELLGGGYDSFWSCSTAKKGYSGTAVFVRRECVHAQGIEGGGGTAAVAVKAAPPKKKKQKKLDQFFTKPKGDDGAGDDGAAPAHLPTVPPSAVTYGIGDVHDDEGRSVTIDLPGVTLTNLYVPNAGAKLERLSARTDGWDARLLDFMREKERARQVPVVWLGDLNVAHAAPDVWNDGAKHLNKCAGTTPEERASFSVQLGAGYVDAFRRLHPDSTGQYSFWSTRAGNRGVNKGLRLDYFVCSAALFGARGTAAAHLPDGSPCAARVVDSSIIPDFLGSDHCPVVMELDMGG